MCNVRPLSIDDLADNSDDSKIFIAYVRASLLLGDVAESCQQGNVTQARFAELRNALLWWLKELPSSIRYFRPEVQPIATEENFNIRQIYTLYLSAVAILHRSIRSAKTPSAIELIASSFIVGLFEDFHARNELRRVTAGFNFYLIVAAIPQLEAVHFSSLRNCTRVEIGVIEDSLRDLGKRWPSANRGLKLLEKVRNVSSRLKDTSNSQCPTRPNESDLLVFEHFDYTKCRMWRPLMESQVELETEPETPEAPVDQLQQDVNIPYLAMPSSHADEVAQSYSNLGVDATSAMIFDFPSWLPDGSFDQDLFGGWMLNDDAFGTNFNF